MQGTFEDILKYIFRFLLFGGVAVIFVALITVAVLIVMMSSKCEELPEGIGLVMPKGQYLFLKNISKW